ncbi:major facilitator superfamily domain-containing protein [Umbelopsis sp. AD052]|nr:major facilitator superfamily domain-containing protein [Umbelopsis sp. AD052]
MSQDIKEKIIVTSDSEKVLEIEDTTVSSQDNHSIITNSDYSPDLQWTEEEEKKVIRKIDIRLMSWVLLMTFVLNMDRTNIANALSDGLPTDLGFNLDYVNQATLIYGIIFTIFTLPTNAIVKKVGAHNWIPFIMFAWGIVTWAHIFVKDYKSYLVVRIFIAITEAGFIPACLTYLTGFYTTSELSARLAWFWAIQSFASAFSGFLSFLIFRLAGVAGLEGWKWLFLIDGILTDVVAVISYFYLPATLSDTDKWIFFRKSWFTERETQIAVTRLIRDDLTKNNQYNTVSWADVKIALMDTKVWTHLAIGCLTTMPVAPISGYLPLIIKQTGFTVYLANLLAAPTYIVGLIGSIFMGRMSEKYGNTALWSLIGIVWSFVGFAMMEFLPDGTDKWTMYGAAFVAASAPTWHGIHIAWMSSNLAPIGKRTLALAWVIGAANIAAVPGSQIYANADAPRFRKGNKILMGIAVATGVLIVLQHIRYVITNKLRQRKWDAMSADEQRAYKETTSDRGSNRLDYRFHI